MLGTNVSATFSEDMNASTISTNGGTFTLRQGGSGGSIVSSGVAYNASTKTATVDPNSNLLNNQQYTAVLTNQIRDLANNALVAKTWSFTTALACTAPAITQQPADQSITYGANATFTAAASGTAGSVKWQKSTDNGANWTDIAGATSSTLTLTKPLVSDSGSKYRTVFTNACGSATSNGAATLQVAQKNLTISGAVANNKPYDRTTNATVNFNGASLVGMESGDTVSIDSSGYSATSPTRPLPITSLSQSRVSPSAARLQATTPSLSRAV